MSYLDEIIEEYPGLDGIIDAIELGFAPSELMLYLHSQLNLLDQKDIYKDESDCIDERFISLLERYSARRDLSRKDTIKVFYSITQLTSEEVALQTLKEIMKQYGITKPFLEELLGYNPGSMSRILNGKQPVRKDILLAIMMFLEFNLTQCVAVLKKSGFSLSTCFPDWVYINHIKVKDFSLDSYVKDVIAQTRITNTIRAKNGLPQIDLPDYYRPERFHPTVSISEFKNVDGYDFTRDNIKKKLY